MTIWTVRKWLSCIYFILYPRNDPSGVSRLYSLLLCLFLAEAGAATRPKATSQRLPAVL